MLILGIESSCDETAAAVVDCSGTRPEIRSNIVSSQVDIHRLFGGVVPELASRRHIETIIPVVEESLSRAGVRLDDLDGIAVTRGPGLIGSLLVGFNFAKAISWSTGIPYVGVSHLESHLFAPLLEHELDTPFLGLVASGGHSSIMWMEEPGNYSILARTRDDAAGEAFDKIAKLLNLGYPGGPAIERAARDGDPGAIRFPRAVMKDGSMDFSFSGVKTAAVLHLRRARTLTPEQVSDLAASFQEAVVDMLTSRVESALQQTGAARLVVSGGVACNARFREKLAILAGEMNVRLFLPSPRLCTDNGAMVAVTGFLYLRRGIVSTFDLNAYPSEAYQPKQKRG